MQHQTAPSPADASFAQQVGLWDPNESTERVPTQALFSDTPLVEKLSPLTPSREPSLPPLRAATVRTFRMLFCNPFEKANFDAAAGSPLPGQNPFEPTLDPHPGGVDSRSMNVDPVDKRSRNPHGRNSKPRCERCRSQRLLVRSRCPSE